MKMQNVSRGGFATRASRLQKASCAFVSQNTKNARSTGFLTAGGGEKLAEESSPGQNFAASGGIAAVQGWLGT